MMNRLMYALFLGGIVAYIACMYVIGYSVMEFMQTAFHAEASEETESNHGNN